MRRTFWILLTPTILFLFLGGVFQLLLWPRLSLFLQNEVRAYTSTQPQIPVIVQAQQVELRWVWPTLILKSVSIQPKPEFAKIISPTEITEVRLQVDPFQILLGRLVLSALTIEGLKTDFNLDPLLNSPSKPQEFPLAQFFKKLSQVPINRLFLEKINLTLHSKDLGGQLTLKDSSLGMLLQAQKLQVRTSIKQAEMDFKKYGKGSLGIETLFQLTPKTLKVLQFETSLNKNKINIEGQVDNFHRIQLHPKANFNFKTSLDLSDLGLQIKNINPSWKLPPVAGEVHSEGQIKIDTFDNLTGQFQLNTRDVQVEAFEIGNAQLSGEFKNRSLLLNKIEALHPAGRLILKKSDLELTHEFKFKTDVDIENLDLLKLFHSLRLGDIPVALQVQGHLPCTGQLVPFVADCEGEVIGKDLHVNSKGNFTGKPIVKLDEFSGNGTLQVDLNQVKYKANVKLGDSQGQSEGTIIYDQGFKISYKSPELNFKNIKNLGNLEMSGVAAVEGSTEGNSHAATFGMKIQAQDYVLEKYRLGSFGTQLSYKEGHLYFKDIEGLMSRSTFQGMLDINFHKNELLGQIDFPRTDLVDVAWIFEDVFPLPVSVSGAGQARLRFEGPLNFWRMNYKLESEFKNGKIATESFGRFLFNLTALDGNIKTDLVEVHKNNSAIRVNGQVSSSQKLKLSGMAEQLKLDESELVNSINSGIFGLLNGKAELTGSISEPRLDLQGRVTDTVIDEQEVPESQFLVKIDRNAIEIKNQLFGEKIISDIQWPFKVGHTPLKINVRTIDWNFTQILSLFDAGFLQNEYQSQLTSEVNLVSENGDLFKSSGKISAINVYLKRGPLTLQNVGPIEITASNGKIDLKNFSLRGQDNYVQLTGNDFTLEQLNLQLKANVELRLLHMFLPFLEDLGGPASGSASITGAIYKPQLLGSAQLQDVFLKLKGFPHPIDRINTEILFSHSKVLVQDLKAQLAGGVVTGSGDVQIQGWRDLPINLKLKAEGINLIIPDKVRSSGNAELVFSGRWFPFLLSGTYNVTSALFEKEFGDESGNLVSARQSNYLPKSLKENSFEPLILDLQVILQRGAEVKNSQMDGTVTGQLQVKGPPLNPILLGRINIEKNTKLVFKDKIFELQSGSVNFNNPTEVNPELYVSAQSRLDEYDINILVQGLAKAPNIRLTSMPPLPEPEIISLLALGVTSQRLEKNVQSGEQATQAGLELGAAVLSKTQINRTLQDRLGVVLQFSSSFDSSKNITVPKAIISKKLSKKVEVSVSRTLRDTSTQEAKLQYLINPSFSANISGEFRESETGTQKASESILGLDLIYKRGFK